MALPAVAIATGDPGGIGPEISLKAALDPAVHAMCRPVLVGDPTVIERHAAACGLSPDLRVVDRLGDIDWSDTRLSLLACRSNEAADLEFGSASAASGRISLAAAR